MKRARGFTLLELIIVLLIGTLMVGLVPPLLSGVGLTTELRSSVRKLAAGMRKARAVAVTSREAAAVTVDLEKRTFQVSGDGRTIQLPDDDNVTVRLYTAQSELIDETSGNIRFFPDGSSTGGYIAVADEKVEYRVNVDWLTGHIRIDDRDAQP